MSRNRKVDKQIDYVTLLSLKAVGRRPIVIANFSFVKTRAQMSNDIFARTQMMIRDARVRDLADVTWMHKHANTSPERKLRYFVDDVCTRGREWRGDFTRGTCNAVTETHDTHLQPCTCDTTRRGAAMWRDGDPKRPPRPSSPSARETASFVAGASLVIF